MAARRVKQIYFTRNDDELWDAIQSIPEGEQNIEIRRALKKYFLGVNTSREAISAPVTMAQTAPGAAQIVEPVTTQEQAPKAQEEAPDAEEAFKKFDISAHIRGGKA